jgi:D-aspartate ligase
VETAVPALMLKLGSYPIHPGGVGAIRTLGRRGVRVYAITESRFTPAAMSRYLEAAFVWPTTGLERPEELVEGLLDVGRRIGEPAVLIPTDDEAAVLVAENARALRSHFLFPTCDDGTLPRRLASKEQLAELCAQTGVPSPLSWAPASLGELRESVDRYRFPLVAKNREAYLRRSSPAVTSTTLIPDAKSLLAMAETWPADPGVLLQEYLPPELCEAWIVNAYFDADSLAHPVFTGVKLRSWPSRAGVMTAGFVANNDELAELTARFAKDVGFRGIADLDWCYDRRDGRYKLLDFNPRVGANFRLFETATGTDVVLAQYLDLTGQPNPRDRQRSGRRFVVEHLDLASRLRSRGFHPAVPPRAHESAGTESAWWARDDLKPVLAVAVHALRAAVRHLTGLRKDRHQGARAEPRGWRRLSRIAPIEGNGFEGLG